VNCHAIITEIAQAGASCHGYGKNVANGLNPLPMRISGLDAIPAACNLNRWASPRSFNYWFRAVSAEKPDPAPFFSSFNPFTGVA
jgi:hypothetical protein